MVTMQTDYPKTNLKNREEDVEVRHEKWAHWSVNWTAIWIGGLAAFSMVLVFGLVEVALGAHLLGPEQRAVDVKKLGIWAVIFSVCGAFFSFVIGGWVAGKIAGILRAEPAMLHGAVVWLVAVPILLVTSALGAANLFGGWYAGLGGTSIASAPFNRPDPLGPSATAAEVATYDAQLTEYHRNVKQWNEDTPKVTRNSALGAVSALLLGLVGSVIGGWMACGEPMHFTHYRTRKPVY